MISVNQITDIPGFMAALTNAITTDDMSDMDALANAIADKDRDAIANVAGRMGIDVDALMAAICER